MRLRGRLDKLETETVAHWHAAWESYSERLFYHTDPLLDPLRAAATEAEAQGLFKDEAALNASCDVFCECIGIPSPFALSAWEAKSELPDLDAPPDLTRWPHHLAEPPPEPLGVREKLEPYKTSPDIRESLPALLYLFWLAYARARREYQTVVKS